MSLDEFETACYYAMGQAGDVQTRASAEAILQQLVENPDGWKFCIQRFPTCVRPESRFRCMQVLLDALTRRQAQLTAEDYAALKAFFVGCLQQYFPQKQNEERYILNKWSSALAACIRLLYPEQWPDLWQHILGSLQHGVMMVDLFGRILHALDEDVVSHEIERPAHESHRAMKIKDAMREGAINSIVEVWEKILSQMGQAYPDIARKALQNIRYYIDWIDIGLIVNDRILPLILAYCNSSGELRIRAFESLHAIARKKMEPAQKMQLLARLQPLELIASINIDGDEDLKVQLARFLQYLCEINLDCWDKFDKLNLPEASAAAEASVVACLPQLLRFFDSQDDEDSLDHVSDRIIEAVNAYVTKLSKVGLTPIRMQHLYAFLQSVASRLKYPPQYNWDHPSDDEADFDKMRLKLCSLFKNISRVAPEEVKNFVAGLIQQILSVPLETVPVPDVEVALSLAYEFGEGLKDLQDPIFLQIVSNVITSRISYIGARCVVIAYQDFLVRYCRSIASNPQLLPLALESFLDARGLRFPHPAVLSKTCANLVKFARACRNELQPLAMELLRGIQDFVVLPIARPQLDVSFEDRQNLFDCVGFLLDGSPQSVQVLQAVLQPLIAQVTQIMTQQLYLQDTYDRPVYVTVLQHLMTAIGNLTKGLQSINSGEIATIRSFFRGALVELCTVLTTLGQNKDIRVKFMFCLHRMIELLRAEVYPLLPDIIVRLLQLCDDSELQEVLRITTQIVSRGKGETHSVIVSIMPILFQRVSNALRPSDIPSIDWEREQKEIRKLFCLFVAQLLVNDLMGVLSDGSLTQQLPGLLSTVMQGLIDASDPPTQKTCSSALATLVQAWQSPDLMVQVVQAMMQATLSANARDAQSLAMLQELASLHLTLYRTFAQTYIDHMSVYLPQCGFPPAYMQQYFAYLGQGDVKNLYLFLKSLKEPRPQ